MNPGACLAFAVLLTATGCGAGSQRRAYEYMPDMARDPAYKAFAPNPATRDGLTLRLPVAGTIPRGYVPFHYGPGEDEAARAGNDLRNPYRATRQVLQEGKTLYETYCLVCHGEQGKGDGPIADKIPRPPSYISDRVLQFPSGRIFHVITMGTKKMPSYAAQTSTDDRWKLVAYVKSLQAAVSPRSALGRGGRP
jgi:mono/diheme cytochrome c family protein